MNLLIILVMVSFNPHKAYPLPEPKVVEKSIRTENQLYCLERYNTTKVVYLVRNSSLRSYCVVGDKLALIEVLI